MGGILIGMGTTTPQFPYDYWYGIEWDTAIASPVCKRIGRTELHQMLPIQSRMKGCLLRDNGTVVKYLNPTNWTTEVLDGSQGQVMVELPEHYRRFEYDGTKRRCLISEQALPGFHFVPKVYIGAFEACVDRTISGILKLASVVNTTAEFRGGNNNAAWDADDRTLLGKASTVISRTNFRNYARNRNSGDTQWNLYTYEAHKSMFWLYFTEYANLNCQLAFNAAKDANGFAQGGLGNGVTTLTSAEWDTFNSYYPIVPCGHTNSLGNASGEVAYTVPMATPKVVYVNRYRGIENPFGHIWKNCDGINVNIKMDADGGTSEVFVCADPSKFIDNGYTDYSSRGLLPRANGYVKEMLIGNYGECMPEVATGAGSTTYWCDNFYTSVTSSFLRTVLFGGAASSGAVAGFGYAYTNFAPSYTTAHFGSRLCFIPLGA
jgi:hypothetical protein